MIVGTLGAHCRLRVSTWKLPLNCALFCLDEVLNRSALRTVVLSIDERVIFVEYVFSSRQDTSI